MPEKKNIIIGLLVCLFLFSTITLGSEVMTLLPSEAVEFALENSPDMKIARINWENNEIDYLKNKAVSDDSRYSQLQIELQYDQVQHSFSAEKNSLIFAILDKYFEILEKQDELLLREKYVELQKSQLEIARSQFTAGHKTGLELSQQERSYDNTVFGLETAKRDGEQLKRDFNLLLGFPVDEEWELIGLKTPEIWEIDKEEVITAIIAHDFSLEVRERQLQLAKIRLERIKLSGISELDLQKEKNNIIIDEIRFMQAEHYLNNSAQYQCYKFQNVIRQLKLNQDILNQAKAAFDIAQQRYQAGIKTENELLAAEISLHKAQKNYNQAITAYYLTELNLKQTMGLPLRSEVDGLLKEE